MQHIAAQYFLNHLLDPEEIRRQVREFAAAGYESLYTHARAGLRTPYLSQAWFQAIDAMADEARKCGITLSLWDEDYFPSPTAGGRVAWLDPNYASQELRFTVLKLSAGETSEQLFPRDAAILNCYAFPDDGSAPIDLTEETGTVQSEWWHFGYSHSGYSGCGKIGSPHIRAGLTYKQFGLLWKATCNCRVVACQLFRVSEGHGTDLLNPKAIDAFIDSTHEKYRKRYGDEFNRTFMATFLDEPAPSGPFPWTGNFPEEFQHDHGFDILPLLGHLAIDIDSSSHFIRHCYRQTVQRLLCESYLDRIRQWDNAHGILSIGHLTRTEFLSLTSILWPNELRCCGSLDVPCTDPLGYFIALPDASAYHTGMKVTASAARLFHKKQCGSDALAVMGNETALRDLAYQLDYQITMGATYFNIHGLNYSLDGPRKEETPPSIFYQHSEWPLMRHLLAETAEKCRLVSSGQPCQRLAVLYPSTDFYCHFDATLNYDTAAENSFHKLSELLLSRQHDFDFIDEQTLAERDTASWRQDYDAILLYHTDFLDFRAADRLEQFLAAGGRVIVVGQALPALLGTREQPEYAWKPARNPELVSELTEAILATLPGIAVEGDGARQILVQERLYPDGQRRLLLFNRASNPFLGTVNGQPTEIPPGTACFAGDRQLKMPENLTDLSGGWSLSFPGNSVPLPIWLTNPEVPYAGGINFLTGELDNIPEFKDRRLYEARFLLQGKPQRLKILMEESSFSTSDWHLEVNGNPVPREAFCPDPVRDCKNLTADLTPFLVCDEVPRLNILRFVATTPACRLLEMPFLIGDFGAEFRHGMLSLPDLWAGNQEKTYSSLPDWRSIGRGGFSGCGTYTRTVTLPENGQYILDCGRVEDAVELYLDGKLVGTRFRSFYRFAFQATAGRHQLELRVWNGPANRDRWSNLPAGLLGPVTLGTLQKN